MNNKELNNYKEMYEKILGYEEKLHAENQNKIKIGIRCLIWIPLIFLLLMFLTDASKVIFLVLWIASLFIIAGYLIYVEYSDFELQGHIREISISNNEADMGEQILIGENIELVEESLSGILDSIEERRDNNKEKMLMTIENKKQAIEKKISKAEEE